MGSFPLPLSPRSQDHRSSPFYFRVCPETGTAHIGDQHRGSFDCRFLLSPRMVPRLGPRLTSRPGPRSTSRPGPRSTPALAANS